MRTILLLFLILLSCTKRNGNNGYENTLGQKNIETLDLIVADFEKSMLKTNYPNENLSDSYLELCKNTLKMIPVKGLMFQSRLRRGLREVS